MKRVHIPAVAAAIAFNSFFSVHAQTSTRGQISIPFTKSDGYRDGPAGNHRDWKAFSRNGGGADAFTIMKSANSGILVVDPTDSGLQILTFEGNGKGIRSDEIHAEITFALRFKEDTSSVRSYKTSVLPLFQFQSIEDKDKKMSFGLQHVTPLAKSPENGNTFNLFIKNTYGDENATSFSERIDGKDLGLAITPEGEWTDGQSVALKLRYSIRFDSDSGSWTETISLSNASGSKTLAQSTQTVEGRDSDAFTKKHHLFRLSPQNMSDEEVAVLINRIHLSTQPPLP